MAENLAGLGRRIKVDPRDNDHPMPRRATSRVRREWNSPPPWDQGNTAMCTAFSANRLLASSPIPQKPLDFDWLYHESQLIDEWPGEDYEGSSVRASFKVLKREGYIGGYQWADDIEPVIEHLLEVGPVCMGTLWTMDMFMPDRHGYIYPGGNLVDAEGHAFCLVGADIARTNPNGTHGAVHFPNSWGRRWGPNRGWSRITFDDLRTLIKNDGEAGVATELRKK